MCHIIICVYFGVWVCPKRQTHTLNPSTLEPNRTTVVQLIEAGTVTCDQCRSDCGEVRHSKPENLWPPET